MSGLSAAPILPGSIGTTHLADDAVTTAKIAAGAVGALEIANGTIASYDIANNAVTEAKIAAGAVETAKIKNAAVTVDKLTTEAKPFGNGQTWQNVTASRAENTVYQNTTGRPILVSIGTTGSGSVSYFEVSNDASTWQKSATLHSATGTGFQAVVPSGHYYRIAKWNGAFWTELR